MFVFKTRAMIKSMTGFGKATVDCGTKEYITPLVTYNKMPYNAMKLNAPLVQTPYHFSLFKLNNSDVTLSVVKKEEEGEGLLVRLYNGTNNKQIVDFSTDLQITNETALDESIIKEVKSNESLIFNPNQTRTLLLKNNF